jgi:hypothetical protein
MRPLADLLLVCGEDGVQMLVAMEKVTRKISPWVFKCFEQFVDPADYVTVVQGVMDPSRKATAQRMKDLASKTLRERWWRWILLNPHIPADVVHPTRSMCPCSPVLPLHCLFPYSVWFWDGWG